MFFPLISASMFLYWYFLLPTLSSLLLLISHTAIIFILVFNSTFNFLNFFSSNILFLQNSTLHWEGYLSEVTLGEEFLESVIVSRSVGPLTLREEVWCFLKSYQVTSMYKICGLKRRQIWPLKILVLFSGEGRLGLFVYRLGSGTIEVQAG